MSPHETFLQTLGEAGSAFEMDPVTAANTRPLAQRHIGQHVRITFNWEGAQHQVSTQIHSARVVVAENCELYLEVNARYLGTKVIDAVVVTNNDTLILLGHHSAYCSTRQETLPCWVEVQRA